MTPLFAVVSRSARRGAEAEEVLLRRAAIRLGLQAAAFVAVVVLLLTTAAALVLLHFDERRTVDLLDTTIARADDVEDPPLDIWLVIEKSSGRESSVGLPVAADDPPALAAVAAGAPAADTARRVHGVDYRVMTVRRADGVTVQAVLDRTVGEVDRRRVLAAMLVTGTLGLLAAAAVGTWLGRRALAPLSSALALQRRFVADAGHELRTPLTLLGTRAQLLHRRLLQVREDADPSRTRYVDLALPDVEGVIADSARLTTILEDLLLAADPLAEPTREPVDLVQLCRDVVRAAGADALDRGIDLDGPVRTDSPVEVLGSSVTLHRALTALVDNALRHAGSVVAVTASRRGTEAVVEVADDGLGVDPALAPRLFTRFASGPPARPTERRRYGLGLALVAEIATAHRGRVELLDSGRPGPAARPAGRTVLRVTLPLHEAAGHRPCPRPA